MTHLLSRTPALSATVVKCVKPRTEAGCHSVPGINWIQMDLQHPLLQRLWSSEKPFKIRAAGSNLWPHPPCSSNPTENAFWLTHLKTKIKNQTEPDLLFSVFSSTLCRSHVDARHWRWLGESPRGFNSVTLSEGVHAKFLSWAKAWRDRWSPGYEASEVLRAKGSPPSNLIPLYLSRARCRGVELSESSAPVLNL